MHLAHDAPMFALRNAMRSPRWLAVIGVTLVALGFLTLALPGVADLAVTGVVGWIMLLSGLAALAAAVLGRTVGQKTWSIVSVVVSMSSGGLLLSNPDVTNVGVVVLVAAYLVVNGVAKAMLAIDFQRRDDRGWAWLISVGFADVGVGVGLAIMATAIASQVVALVVGADFLLTGFALIALGLAERRGVDASPP